MLKFFEEQEIDEMPKEEQEKIHNQPLDEVTSFYNHNFGNFDKILIFFHNFFISIIS